MFHVADDIFQHDNGVINNKADRKCQGHQGDVVDGKAERRHGGKGTDNRQWQSQTWNQCGGEVAQKQEDHHDDQGNGQKQCELDLLNRFANGHGTVVMNVDVDGSRNLAAKIRDQLLDVIYNFNGIGAGLALDSQYNGPG